MNCGLLRMKICDTVLDWFLVQLTRRYNSGPALWTTKTAKICWQRTPQPPHMKVRVCVMASEWSSGYVDGLPSTRPRWNRQ